MGATASFVIGGRRFQIGTCFLFGFIVVANSQPTQNGTRRSAHYSSDNTCRKDSGQSNIR